MKKSLALLLGCLLPFIAAAQITFSSYDSVSVSLAGRVTDAATGQPLVGAVVYLDNISIGVSTIANGRYSFPSLLAGDYVMTVSYLGYTKDRIFLELGEDKIQDIALHRADNTTKEVLITANRANEKTGTTYTNVSKEELENRNFGQDLPYLLEHTPSLVTNSDAGAGVGYTSMRIRGSDVTRINVTVNGIPVNDSESHGVFFVNMPDFATSVQDLQIQRGVGTSTNGAGAFGASINMQTLEANPEAYARTDNAYGSYNTLKNNIQLGTGLLNGKFAVDGRLSRITSDGYIDRASSDLKSFYLSGGYYGEKDMLKLVIFGGQERTYQAWNGVDAETLETNRTYNSAGTDYGSKEDPYDDEVDNYGQNHYQLHYAHEFSPELTLNTALHYTQGQGFYETYKVNARLSAYNLGLRSDRSDLVRRKWLDNDFYGTTFSLQYNGAGKLSAVVGGGWNRYIGDHFGEVIWARNAPAAETKHRYYDNTAFKTDFNAYAKATLQATDKLGFFGDVQVRTISYEIEGIDDDRRDVTTQADYTFFNPKAGVTFAVSPRQSLYASVAVGHREPTRSDFTDRPLSAPAPTAERMIDYEAGYRLNQPIGEFAGQSLLLSSNLNFFYMDYKDQLVLTGRINDVGTALRTNIADSYRAGVELSAGVGLGELARLSTNLAFSRNRIKQFNEVLAIDYNPEDVVQNQYDETTISYSPSAVTSTQLEIQPLAGLRFMVLYKTVSEQFLDNTANQSRRLAPYQVGDARIFYSFKPVSWMKEIELGLLVNNIFNKLYVANGYTFTELYSGDANRYDYNYYFPQAPRNFLTQVSLRF